MMGSHSLGSILLLQTNKQMSSYQLSLQNGKHLVQSRRPMHLLRSRSSLTASCHGDFPKADLMCIWQENVCWWGVLGCKGPEPSPHLFPLSYRNPCPERTEGPVVTQVGCESGKTWVGAGVCVVLAS